MRPSSCGSIQSLAITDSLTSGIPSTHPSIHPPTHPSIHPSIHQPTHPPIHPFTHPPVHPPTHPPSVHPSMQPHATIHPPTPNLTTHPPRQPYGVFHTSFGLLHLRSPWMTEQSSIPLNSIPRSAHSNDLQLKNFGQQHWRATADRVDNSAAGIRANAFGLWAYLQPMALGLGRT